MVSASVQGERSEADGRSDEVPSLLQRSKQLAAAGEFRLAIDELTAANRRLHDPAIEKRLVQLRHQAFASLEIGPGREDWPPDYPDAFPDVSGRPPEITLAELDHEVLGGALQHHGCLHVRGLIREPRLSQLLEDTKRAFAVLDEREDEGWPTDKAPWFFPFKPGEGYAIGYGRKWTFAGGGVWTVDSPRALFDLIEAFEEIGLGQVLTDYLGERPAISVKKSTLRRVPIDIGTDWHQDGAFLGEGIRTVNVWVSLTDCGVDSPGLDIVPRRIGEVVETGSHGAQFDWSVGPGMVEQVAQGVDVIRPPFEAGDALLFDEVFLHRTGVAPGMVRPRYAIETWFFAPSRYPEAQIPIVY